MADFFLHNQLVGCSICVLRGLLWSWSLPGLRSCIWPVLGTSMELTNCSLLVCHQDFYLSLGSHYLNLLNSC